MKAQFNILTVCYMDVDKGGCRIKRRHTMLFRLKSSYYIPYIFNFYTASV